MMLTASTSIARLPYHPSTAAASIKSGRKVVRNVWILLLALLSLIPFFMLSTQAPDYYSKSTSSSTYTNGMTMLPSSNVRPFYERHFDWQESTLLVTIAFANATKTHMVERLVTSLQTNGQWTQGRIVIVTDRPQRYETQYNIIRWNNDTASHHLRSTSSTSFSRNIIILEAKPQDLYPTKKIKGQSKRIEFKREAMRYKRFKTILLDYLGEYAQLSQRPYQFAMYIDVDIVVARPMTILLREFQEQMIDKGVFASVDNFEPATTRVDTTKNNNGNNTKTKNDKDEKEAAIIRTLPFMAMFTDCPTCARHNTNGGVMLLHRIRSRPCLKEWNDLYLQNADWGVYDQRYLRDIRANGNCKIHVLPDHHRLYPTWKDMRLLLSQTIVHNSNTYNAKKIPPHVQAKYFAYLVPDFFSVERGMGDNKKMSGQELEFF